MSELEQKSDLKEQRICIKFCFKLGKTASETHKLLKQAFGDAAMGKSQTYEWYSRFKRGQISVKDSVRSGRPSTSRNEQNVEKVRQAILEDSGRTIKDICNIVGISAGSCHRILTEELNFRSISRKFDKKKNKVNKSLNDSSDSNTLEDEPLSAEETLDNRIQNDRMDYYLKCKGYEEEINTWEPEVNLTCPDLIPEIEHTENKEEEVNSEEGSNYGEGLCTKFQESS